MSSLFAAASPLAVCLTPPGAWGDSGGGADALVPFKSLASAALMADAAALIRWVIDDTAAAS